ncbi:MAG: glycosyltransferase [Desulfobacterales bacterium]|nr:glycosyltransferase [Desulfobacterales bacterium]
MTKVNRIFIVADISYKPIKMFLDQMHKLTKGFIRLGHDVRLFSYCNVLAQQSPLKSRTFSEYFFKSKVDNLLADQLKNYEPDIVYISFARALDGQSIECMRQAAPNAVFIGTDGDPWPKLQRNRIETAKKLDMLTATNDGQFLRDYKDAGVPLCVFMPNMCDPDIDHRYDVGPEWRADILWTGKAKHHADTSEVFREKLVMELIKRKNCSVYGCFGKPKISGKNYLYAISGAKIGVNVNAYGSVKLCHSDRLTHYLACGTFVMAKRFEGCNLLYKDNEHLRYFDTAEEFFELLDWYLNHESERKKIADAGMKRVHEHFNSVKIAGYILDLAQTGSYKAPWFGD